MCNVILQPSIRANIESQKFFQGHIVGINILALITSFKDLFLLMPPRNMVQKQINIISHENFFFIL